MHRHALVLAALCTVFAACGPKDTVAPQKDSVVDDLGQKEYEADGCRFKFEEGDSTAPLTGANVREEFLRKRIDFANLTAVSGASAAATVRFIEAQGVHVVSPTGTGGGCNIFASLPTPAQDIQDEWTKAAGGLRSLGSLVGLYIARGDENVSSAKNAPYIGIRADSNRWTLVHEFSHHLFDEQVLKDHGLPVYELRPRFSAAINAFVESAKAYDRAQSEAAFRKVVDRAVDYAKILEEKLRRFELEEVAVETMLQEESQAGRFRTMPEIGLSSDAYIAGSAERADKSIRALSDGFDRLRQESNKWSLNDESARLRDALGPLSAMDNEAVSAENNADARLRQKGAYRSHKNSLHGPGVPRRVASCRSDGDEDEKVLAAIQQLGQRH